MNNSQFRKLVLDTPARQSSTTESKSTLGATPRPDGPPSALGSRMRSSIPMTPRSVGGVDFARQLAESQSSSSSQPTRKFRSSAAPKGTKLPSAYVDRSKLRQEEITDDKAERVKALEELMKLQQIDEETFKKLRDEILGGDVASTHLVKGLDWKLLERVKRGEDVLNGVNNEEIEDEEDKGAEVDLDEEFDILEDKEIKAVDKVKMSKKGEMAPPSLVPGKKRTRDQILAEMKAARKAAQEAKGPGLGAKFKKVGDRRVESRIERDEKGREVLITVDENGNEKRKVRRVQVKQEVEKGHGLLMPDKDAKPLGMEVPDIPKVVEEDEDMDIFDGAGDDYDPLAGIGDDEDDSDAQEGEVAKESVEKEPGQKPELGSMAPPRPKQPAAPRNYFGDSAKSAETTVPKTFTDDPTIRAAIKKASTLNTFAKEAESPEETAKQARLKKMLKQDERDAQDIDIGFGSSRFEDEEDFEDKKIKLSAWGGKNDDEDGAGGEAKGKRKRGPKKRKGDANNAEDVMRVLKGRKTADS